jgi:hypothetical protein
MTGGAISPEAITERVFAGQHGADADPNATTLDTMGEPRP